MGRRVLEMGGNGRCGREGQNRPKKRGATCSRKMPKRPKCQGPWGENEKWTEVTRVQLVSPRSSHFQPVQKSQVGAKKCICEREIRWGETLSKRPRPSLCLIIMTNYYTTGPGTSLENRQVLPKQSYLPSIISLALLLLRHCTTPSRSLPTCVPSLSEIDIPNRADGPANQSG